MAYKTYTTEAIVCGSRDSYTSDRSYLLFTERAGMLWASARSVREEKSKQRYALQDFSIIRVSLVRGRSGWRVGSVESERNAFTDSCTREARGGVTRVLRLIRQFVHGEDPHPRIFKDTKDVLKHLCSVDSSAVDGVVDLYTLRTLHKLGYVAPHVAYTKLLEDDEWLAHTDALPKEATKAVEQALRVSHL